MKLLITGANGFLGRYVVAQALRRGHEVRALVRPVTDVSGLPWGSDERVEIARCDLRSANGLAEHLVGVDAVLHLAAAKQGDIYAQLGGTVVTTENLLAAMTDAGVFRIVAISSFSVYEYLHRVSYTTLDESSALVSKPQNRDEYAQTKLLQEELIREHGREHGLMVTVLRPGVIYGRDNLWTARLGMQISNRWWLRTGAWAPLPLTYVENCAQAIVLSAEKDEAIGQTLNVVDDDPPTQRRYMAAIRPLFTPKPRVIPVAWFIMRSLARLAWLTNMIMFQGRAKVPGIFVPAKLHARCKPMRYSNDLIREVLGWQPEYSLEQALARSTGTQPEANHDDPSLANPVEEEVATGMGG